MSLNHSSDKIKEQLEVDPKNSILYQQKGDVLLSENNFYQALIYYTKSIIFNPSNNAAWKGKGLISFLMDVRNDAIQCFDKSISINPNDYEAFRLKSHSYGTNQSNFKKINFCIDKAEQLNPNNIDIIISKGIILKNQLKNKESLEYFKKVLSKEPDCLIAKIYQLKLDNSRKSVFNLVDFLKTQKYIDTKNFAELGNSLFLQLDFDNALLCYEEEIRSNPTNSEILFKIGLLFLIENNLRKSLEFLNNSLEINPKNTLVWTRKGEIYRRQNKIVEAIECFDKAINIDEQNAEAWRRKGFTQSMRHLKIDDVLSCLNKSISLDPWHPMTYVQKALFLRRYEEKWKESSNCLEQALGIDPTFVLAWQIKGQLHVSDNNFESALACYKKIVELDQDDIISWYNEGVVKAKFAETKFQESVEFTKNSNFEQALYSIEKVIQIDSEDPEAYFQRGLLLLKMGKKEESKKNFDYALKLDPKNEKLLNKINNIFNK